MWIDFVINFLLTRYTSGVSSSYEDSSSRPSGTRRVNRASLDFHSPSPSHPTGTRRELIALSVAYKSISLQRPELLVDAVVFFDQFLVGADLGDFAAIHDDNAISLHDGG